MPTLQVMSEHDGRAAWLLYAGSAIAWSSQLLTVGGILKTVAEFIEPVGEGGKELLWLKRLLGELGVKGVIKKDRTRLYCSFYSILSTDPLKVVHYWRYTVSVSSIVEMLPGMHFLSWRAALLSHFPESPLWFGNDVLSNWF
jgi:hypothetical protein